MEYWVLAVGDTRRSHGIPTGTGESSPLEAILRQGQTVAQRAVDVMGRDGASGHDQPTPARGPPRTGGSSAGGAIVFVIDLVVPVALYYGLRSLGVSMYLALIAGALASGAGAAVGLIRNRRLDRLAIYVMTTMSVSLGLSLVAGSPRFLLAKQGWLTGLTGVWFLASARGSRPLALLFSRPLLEGRFGWPDRWDEVWERVPGFRRVWRVSSLLWGVSALLDAALRVLMAYTLPIDVVPALGAALNGGTAVVMILVSNVYYVASGAANRHSALYEPPDSGHGRTGESLDGPVSSAASI